MNIYKSFRPFMGLAILYIGSSRYIYAEGGQHIDPLSAMNGTVRNIDTTSRQNRRSTRHFSPMDAINGKIIVKDKQPITSGQNTSKTSTPDHTPAKRPKPTISQTHTTTPEYTQIPYDLKHPHTNKKSTRKTLTTPHKQTKKIEIIVTSPKDKTNTLHKNPKTHTANKQTPSNKPAGQTTLNLKAEEVGGESPGSHLLLQALSEPASTEYTSNYTAEHNLSNKYKNKNDKTIYLTFDDGPCGGTAELLKLIKSENIQVTMFFIGGNVERHKNLFHKALASPNIMVANHTYTHASNHYRKFYTGPVRVVVNDIDKAQQVIGGAKYLRLAGRNVWRLPKIHKNDLAIKPSQRSKEVGKYDALSSRGYYIYGWDVEWNFSYKNQRPLFDGETMARKVNIAYRKQNHLVTKNKVVLLAHDYMWRKPRDLAQLKLFIHILKAQHWKFDTINNYTDTTPSVLVMKNNSEQGSNRRLKPAQKLAQQATVLPQVATKKIVPKIKISSLKDKLNPIRSFDITTDMSTLLTQAIRDQNFVETRRLLALGADINTEDKYGHLPLNIAVETNNAALVKMLIDRGARILNMDSQGMSPMGVAREHHNTIIIRYFIWQIKKEQKFRLGNKLYEMKNQ